MANRFKHHVCRRVFNILNKTVSSENDIATFAKKVELKRFPDSKIGILLSSKLLSQSSENTFINKCTKVKNELQGDEIISDVSIIESQGYPNIFIHLNREMFIKLTLESRPSKQQANPSKKHILVEYSSPNIAKPFHVGHLRSTIIGNFVSNLLEWFGHDVTRLNYLGDWGTQFGLVKTGMEMIKPTPEEFGSKPLHTLYQAYVTANAAAEKNSEILDQARKLFMNLERGKDDDVSDWKQYKECTISDLTRTYSRLGIKFNAYSWESDYKATSITHIIELMKSRGHLKTDGEGRTVMNVDGKAVPLLKSDGTTLYLTRDIAAAIDRKTKYNFDEMYYFADASQHKHFKNLFAILKDLEFCWSNDLKHIPFGRVRGMSTRHGTAVFLNDILNEAQQIMLKQQKASPTFKDEIIPYKLDTRVDLSEDQKTADILGVSTLIMADLVHKRRKDYTFNWDSARSVTGNTGVRLQYTHCRLTSLAEKCGLSPASYCDPNSLKEPVAIDLVYEICRFNDVLQKSLEELEASRLSEYLFSLCDATNKALIALQVTNAGRVGEQRLLLFEEARAVLNSGMKILGLIPLSQM